MIGRGTASGAPTGPLTTRLPDEQQGASAEWPSPPVFEVRAVSKTFSGTAAPAVDGVTLALNPGELLALLGPSGCGKTTTLRLIAGFERPDAGEVWLNGRQAAGPGVWRPPEQRHLGMVFQDYALFPHLTVEQNVAFGLRGLDVAARRARARELLALVGLAAHAARYPHQLSGGQQQRVALARALAPRPNALLLDEPFSNLDPAERARVRQEVREILQREHIAALLVTHDQEEALAWADRVAVMCGGRLCQEGRPAAVYHTPQTRFVAGFLGRAAFLSVEVAGPTLLTEVGSLPNPGLAPGAPLELLVRPEDLTFAVDPLGPARLVDCEFHGARASYAIRSPSGRLLWCERPGADRHPVGCAVRLLLHPRHLVLFSGDRAVFSSCTAAGACACQQRPADHRSQLPVE